MKKVPCFDFDLDWAWQGMKISSLGQNIRDPEMKSRMLNSLDVEKTVGGRRCSNIYCLCKNNVRRTNQKKKMDYETLYGNTKLIKMYTSW